MNFSLTEDQVLIREAAQTFLTEACDSAAVRRAIDTPTGIDDPLWQRMGQELGWCATAIPEAFDGLGLGPVELVLLFEQMGRRLPCVPAFSTLALAATALSEAGSPAAQARWLPRVAAGALRATLVWSANGVQWDPAAPGVTAVRTPAGWRLQGHCQHVPDGATADCLLVVARVAETALDAAPAAGDEGGAWGLFALPGDTAGITRSSHPTWDATRRLAAVSFHGVELADEARIDHVAPGRARLTEAFERTEALAALWLAAEQVGGAQQCLDLTLAYTRERVQFGQPIAAFQAVKHRCAEMMVRLEAARSAVYGAAALAAAAPATALLCLEAGAAKAQASEAYCFCAQEALQLHGGVGFTWEYDPHLYLKRAQASSRWLGTPEQWRERIAHALLDGETACN